MTTPLSLRPGDRVPDFALPGLDGKHRKFIWSFTGAPVALIAVDDLSNLDVGQFTALIDACAKAAVMPVVMAGNAMAAAAAPWAKLGGTPDAPLLLCDPDRRFLTALLAQGGMGLGPVGSLRMRVIVLDPAATLATPMDLMLSTGLKAVDHAVERLCSQQAHPFVLGTATEALKLLARALPAHKARPDDMATRLDLQFGMWLSIGAGTSGVGVGASHGIGHVLGAACQVPHGHTSCVMLPSVLRWNLPSNAERQKRVGEAFGQPAAAAGDLVEALVKSLGLPGRLGEVGVGRDRFREIAEKSMHDRAVLNNPRPIEGPAQVMEILELAA